MPQTQDVYWLIGRADEIALDASQKFWKELIHEGRWTNARAGFTLDVDRPRLAAWKRNFDAMLDAGIRVPVPWGHSYDPRDNAGFLEEIEIRDRSLWGLLCVPAGDDAQRLGRTVCGVSVSINPNFIDGTGRRWGEVIEHVALTNYPVVVDQSDFIQASTQSGEPARAIALELSHDGDAAQSVEVKLPEDGGGRQECLPHLQDKDATRQTAEEAPASAGTTATADLSLRLCTLEREQAEREVDEAMRLGKFSRPAAEALRQLVSAGLTARYSLDATGSTLGNASDEADVIALAHQIIANTPAGAAVDMREHTRLHTIPNPTETGMTEAKAAKLAKENRELAGL